jgi:hypothetical protein
LDCAHIKYCLEGEDDDDEEDKGLEDEAAAVHAHSIESEMKAKGYQLVPKTLLWSRRSVSMCHSVAGGFYFCDASDKSKGQYCSRCADGHAPSLKPSPRKASRPGAASAASVRSSIKKTGGKKDAQRYDDDEDTDECIVYPDRPLQGGYYIHKRSQLRKPPFEGELVSM